MLLMDTLRCLMFASFVQFFFLGGGHI
uniref:Uncharacterized protein MANES_03G128200 n=1 Tax=Rhizophora mucronata TaxID=61149 RepID=A0A2P2LSL7_RHIMU